VPQRQISNDVLLNVSVGRVGRGFQQRGGGAMISHRKTLHGTSSATQAFALSGL
jgi:hypothetical protein